MLGKGRLYTGGRGRCSGRIGRRSRRRRNGVRPGRQCGRDCGFTARRRRWQCSGNFARRRRQRRRGRIVRCCGRRRNGTRPGRCRSSGHTGTRSGRQRVRIRRRRRKGIAVGMRRGRLGAVSGPGRLLMRLRGPRPLLVVRRFVAMMRRRRHRCRLRRADGTGGGQQSRQHDAETQQHSSGLHGRWF